MDTAFLELNRKKAGEVGMTINEWAKDFRSFVNELQMQRDDYKVIMEYIDDALSLLKKQEAVEPIRDAISVRKFRCGACGAYVGFIDSYPGDTKEQDNYCRNCGRPVKWK